MLSSSMFSAKVLIPTATFTSYYLFSSDYAKCGYQMPDIYYTLSMKVLSYKAQKTYTYFIAITVRGIFGKKNPLLKIVSIFRLTEL